VGGTKIPTILYIYIIEVGTYYVLFGRCRLECGKITETCRSNLFITYLGATGVNYCYYFYLKSRAINRIAGTSFKIKII